MFHFDCLRGGGTGSGEGQQAELELGFAEPWPGDEPDKDG